MIVASTVPVPPIWMTRAILMRLFSSIVTGWPLLPNCPPLSTLTFRFVTPRWTDPAEASDATLTANNAANARSSLAHLIALPLLHFCRRRGRTQLSGDSGQVAELNAPNWDRKLLVDWPAWPTNATLFTPACPTDADVVP